MVEGVVKDSTNCVVIDDPDSRRIGTSEDADGKFISNPWTGERGAVVVVGEDAGIDGYTGELLLDVLHCRAGWSRGWKKDNPQQVY